MLAIDKLGTTVAHETFIQQERHESMTRSAVTWTKLGCDGADIMFRAHWAGLVEVVCGDCRVMLSYSGRERLANLPNESLIILLRSLLQVARAERRNRASADLLCAHLERSMQRDREEAELTSTGVL